jgi:hypothetical protein
MPERARSRSSYTLRSALDAARRDQIAQWVGDFLASRGSDNATLAAALAQREHCWVGPALVRLSDLVPLAGPDDETLCPVEPDEWEADVDALEENVEEGWTPPPLLAEYRDGQFLLQDGNHRYEALLRAGESEAWVIVWSDDLAACQEVRDRVRAPAS